MMTSIRSLALALAIALLGAPIAAQAQVVADPGSGHRPTVDTSANGTPVINITAPTQGGVSHNQYQNFNVDPKGVILNNNSAVSQTQQAGYIVGNSNLANGQSARIIVNEVTSQNPSNLRGFTEVAGNRAEVVIANPNGITCDGCGFINTSRGTLVTGTPVFGGDGSLAAFRVTRGTLAINGAGLNGTGTDRLDLIARTVAANAKVWANELNVVTGANQVNYYDLSTQVLKGEGDTSGVSLDVAALGGMYANKIRLVGTEGGVGVRNAGELATTSGDFTITQAGRLELTGRTTSTGQIVVKGAGLNNSGTLAAGSNLLVSSSGDIANSGTIYGTTDTSLTGSKALTNSGKVYAVGGSLNVDVASISNASGGDIYSGKDMALRAGGIDNAAAIQAGGALALHASDHLGNTSTGTIVAGSSLGLEVSGAVTNNGQIYATSDATLHADTLTNGNLIGSDGNLAVTVAGNIANSATMQAGQSLALDTSGSLTNSGKLYAIGGALSATAGQQFDNAASGDIYAKTDARLDAGAMTNAGSVAAQRDLTVNTSTSLDNSGKLYAVGGALTVTSGQGFINATTGDIYAKTDGSVNAGAVTNAGSVEAGRNLDIHAATSLDNSGKLLADTGNATLAATDITQRGVVSAANDVTMSASDDIDHSGTTIADNDIVLSGNSVTNEAGATLLANGKLHADVQGFLNNAGTLASKGNVTLLAGSLVSTGVLGAGIQSDGSLGTSGVLDATVAGVLAVHGNALAAADLSLKAGSLDLAGAHIRAGGDIALAAMSGGLDTAGGDVATAGNLSARASGALTNRGGTWQGGVLDIQAGSLDNTGGTLTQTGTTDQLLAISETLDNSNGHIASNAKNLSLQAGSIANNGGSVEHAGDGTLSVTGTGGIANRAGHIVGNGDLDLITNGALDSTGGTISLTRGATIDAASFANDSGTVVASALAVTLSGNLGNNGGTLQSGGATTITAGSLANGTGQIKALSAELARLTIAGAMSSGIGGFIGGNGGLWLRAGSIDNSGQLYATTTADVATTAGNLVNHGAIQSMGSSSVVANGSLTNDGGRIESGSGDTSASLTVKGNAFSNVGGRIANAGQGQTNVTATGVIANQNGTLGGQGGVSIVAAGLANAGGGVVAGRDMALTLGGFDNTGGNVYAAGNLTWSNTGATLTNTSGQFGSGVRLALTLAWLQNASGNTSSNGDVSLNLAQGITGSGRIIAGNDLDVALPGSFTNDAGSQLKANHNFGLHLGGAFTNADGASLLSVGALTIDAASIENGSGATIDSVSTTLNSRGAVNNRGRIEGDALNVSGSDIVNTGTLIGDAIAVRANNLTNGADLGGVADNNAYQSALIAATHNITLLIGGSFINRDALVFSLGDIFIAADTNGARAQWILNNSGDIEADGSILLAASQITNQRRVFETTTYVLSAAEQLANHQVGGPVARYLPSDTNAAHQVPNVAPNQIVDANEVAVAKAYCESHDDDNNRCIGYPQGKGSPNTFQATYTDTLVSIERLSRTSAEGRIAAGGSITLNASVTNDKSTVAAAQNLVINGADQSALAEGDTAINGDIIRNIGWNPTGTVATDASYGVGWQSLHHSPREWLDNGFREYATSSTSATIALGDGQRPAWITMDPGQGLSGRMTAGNTLEIHGTTITNTTVGADGRPISGVGLGANASASNVSGNASGSVSGVGGSLDLGGVASVSGVGTVTGDTRNAGPRPGAQTVGSLHLPDSGLYTTHPGSGSHYLVETDPRFASQAGFLGSDYLMDRLGFNGEDTMKRLGDGFYEQRLVLDQITSLTGRRYLDNNSDAMSQYRALMDAGVDAAGKFQLSVGVALTADQMANLTQDIVWMVSQQVDGESVLVPVVYLSAAHAQEVAQNGAILSGKTVLLDASGTVTNTGTIAASQDATLKAGTLLNGGNLSAGGNLSVTAAQDILNAGTIKGGNVSLSAGNDILSGAGLGKVDLGGVALGDSMSALDAARLGRTPGGSIDATGNLSLGAGRDLTLNVAPVTAGGNLSLSAGRDLTATATAIKAGGDAQLIAGRDLSLNATGQTTAVRKDGDHTETTTHTITTIDAGGSAILAAGRDVVSQGASVKAGDQVAVSAGRDVVLDAITDTTTHEVHTRDGGKSIQTNTMDQTLTGSSLAGANGVIVSAGHDIDATAATITSDKGGVALAAKNDVNLNAGTETHTWEQATKSKKSGLMSSTTKTALDATEDNIAVGTLISGDSVTVAAGHDITAYGAQIGATYDLTMAAGNNLTIGTAETTHSETHDKTVKKSGLMSGGGFSVMIGGSKEENGYEEQDSTPTGSVIGSTDGNVTLTAGNTVHITGSDVLSRESTTIVGKDVTIDAAVATTDSKQTYKKQTAGITLGLTGGAVSALQGAYGAAKRGGQVSDNRLKALYAAQAAQDLFSDGAGRGMGLGGDGMDSIGSLGGAANAYSDAGGGAAGAEAAGQQTGISLRIGIGASSASSETKTHDERAYGSNIRSNGDINIAATGGDLNIIGSNIDGRNVALAAANNLNLLSQAEDHSSKSTNRNGSGEIGISIGSQTGIYVSASAGMGKAVGNGTTHAESVINASDTLTIVSGNDTTIKGAQLKGDSVIGAIGGNLLIQSEQDTDDYASKQQQIGASVTFGYGGSFNYSQSKVNSHYDSVNEVSGISAGHGGFDLTVGGNTHLVGGVIASTADPSKNILDTGSLTWESIHNEASYSASTFGVGGGSGGGGFSMGPTGLPIADKDHKSSDTESSIAAGTIITRDGNTDLSGLKRDGTLENQALKQIFDEKKVSETLELGQVAGQVGMVGVGDLSDYMYSHASSEAEKAKWEDGGTNKILLHGIVGAAMAAMGGGSAVDGGLGAAGGEAGIRGMLEYLDANHIPRNSDEGRALMQLGAIAIGASLGGGTGATTALTGDQYNRVLHPDYVRRLDDLADQFAASQGISKDDARNRLIVQAFRTQDARYDDYLSSQQKPDDMAALEFLAHTDGVVGAYDHAGNTLNLSGASQDERYNPSMFANDLAQDPQAQAWFKQATGYSGDYLNQLARNDYYGNQLPAYGEAYADWQTHQDLRKMLSFTPIGGWEEAGERAYRGDYSGAGKGAAKEIGINLAGFGVGKAIGAAAGAIKTAIKDGVAAKDAAKEVLTTASDLASAETRIVTTAPVKVAGERAIDKAQDYERNIASLYGESEVADRGFTTVVDGKVVKGIADELTVVAGKETAVEAKFVDEWSASLRNPASPMGGKPWAVAEQAKMVEQAKKYQAAFEGGVIYHTNSTELANYYTKIFQDAGVTKFKFVITPAIQ